VQERNCTTCHSAENENGASLEAHQEAYQDLDSVDQDGAHRSCPKPRFCPESGASGSSGPPRKGTVDIVTTQQQSQKSRTGTDTGSSGPHEPLEVGHVDSSEGKGVNTLVSNIDSSLQVIDSIGDELPFLEPEPVPSEDSGSQHERTRKCCFLQSQTTAVRETKIQPKASVDVIRYCNSGKPNSRLEQDNAMGNPLSNSIQQAPESGKQFLEHQWTAKQVCKETHKNVQQKDFTVQKSANDDAFSSKNQRASSDCVQCDMSAGLPEPYSMACCSSKQDHMHTSRVHGDRCMAQPVTGKTDSVEQVGTQAVEETDHTQRIDGFSDKEVNNGTTAVNACSRIVHGTGADAEYGVSLGSTGAQEGLDRNRINMGTADASHGHINGGGSKMNEHTAAPCKINDDWTLSCRTETQATDGAHNQGTGKPLYASGRRLPCGWQYDLLMRKINCVQQYC
jgi:hypothetical protein